MGSDDAPWEERLPGNVCGRASALTTLAPMRPWRVRLLAALFWLRRHAPRAYRRRHARPLQDLAFIHFARWTIVPRLAGSESWEDERLGTTYLYFESNFNGGFDAYIDAFAYVLPGSMSKIWNGAYGFPGPRPATPFKAFISRHEYAAQHFYCAYPEATATDVTRALAALDGLEALIADHHRLPAKAATAFAERWTAFLTSHQRAL